MSIYRNGQKYRSWDIGRLVKRYVHLIADQIHFSRSEGRKITEKWLGGPSISSVSSNTTK